MMIKIVKNRIERLNYGLLCALFVLPTPSFAATLESVINSSVRYLQGTLARAIGIAVIVITGYLCLAKQKFPKEQFVMVLVGLGIIFGASSIYSTVTG
jgi:type IV secretion system protein VirB2